MQLCWIGTCLSQSWVLLVTGLAVLQDFSKLLAPNLFLLIFLEFLLFLFSVLFLLCACLLCGNI